MKTKVRIAIGLLAIVLPIVLLIEGIWIPKRLQPDVLPLRFKEYRTNDKLTAVFEIENESASPVVVWEAAELIAYWETGNEQQEISIQRTIIPEDETGTLVVDAPRECAWQVWFRVARFGPREQERFESGQPVRGTIVYSEVVPKYESRP